MLLCLPYTATVASFPTAAFTLNGVTTAKHDMICQVNKWQVNTTSAHNDTVQHPGSFGSIQYEHTGSDVQASAASNAVSATASTSSQQELKCRSHFGHVTCTG